MNLRRIIREEMDEFDWIRDQDPTAISDEDIMKWENKRISYLSLGGSKGRVINREWSTFNAFIIALEELGETEFINWLIKKTLPQEVSRPYPYILEAIKEFGFDVNKSDETKRLYNIFYKSQPIFKRLKNKVFGENINEFNNMEWIEDQDPLSAGSCITKHLHKLHPEDYGPNSEIYKELGPQNLDYIIVGEKNDEIIIRPKAFQNDERLYSGINKKELSNHIISKKISFCEH